MILERLYTCIQTLSLLSGAFLGYRHGYHVQYLLNTPQIKPYKERYLLPAKGQYITETLFCNLVGCGIGICIGSVWFSWPVLIPYTLFILEKQYGNDIRKFLVIK